MRYVIAILCSLTVGLMLGLLVAAMTSESFENLEDERDQLTKKLDEIKAAAEQAEAKVVGLKAERETETIRLKTEAEKNQTIGEQFAKEWLRGLALLQMCIDNQAVIELLRSDHFRASFKRDWYRPELAYKMIGGRWFAEEMLASKVIDQELFDDMMAAGEQLTKRRWHVDGRKTTETFEVRTPVWRLCWQSRGYVSITCYRDDQTTIASASAECSDSSVVYDGPGRYYLELFSIDPSEVWVEEIGTPDMKPSADKPAETKPHFTEPPW